MPYLTVDDYVERYGIAETVRVTDESKAGEVNAPKVEKAIADATAEADSYLAVRYVLPIPAPAPEIVVAIVGDLARERLTRARPTELVIANAARARSQLKDLSAGRASIPATAAGAAPPGEIPIGMAVAAGDGRPRVFNDVALSDFVNIGYPRGRTVFDGPCGW